ncbi:alkyldihydroxyacetonephosphate synthase isoform X2 [Photinus pyralis]|uniref:Alkylglycerone-phosphate synthase n=1 Tax=Photinus pyralis TaxID=7054 RepID=A0A1Y1MS72_PHOPY|nr:alkyldihydroxyacetonephosphate synthase isoform X2 [Photinus pyralis]
MEELLKWNGWGYKDSRFLVKDGIIHFSGSRYPIGELSLPYFTQWVEDVLGVDLSKPHTSKDQPVEEECPYPLISNDNYKQIVHLNVPFSTKGIDRLMRAHGHTVYDIYTLKESFFDRIPDVVLWPSCHGDVVKIVDAADKNNMVVIPFGGGTSVTGAVECPKDEMRTIISLDTSQMNKILWVDRENLVICCESGIIGQDLERELHTMGFTVGHEPDSYEFSSLGGWVATRASGMKKNTYGNIEDLLVHVKMVTPKGVLEKNCQVPRMSCGPDFNHIVLGSEGCLGVITEVILKIRPLPKMKKYGSVVFPDFESGVRCMREVAKQRCQPASIRLMDNAQFKFGQSLRPVPGYFGLIFDGLKKLYIKKIKGFNFDSICVMTLLFEGDVKDVQMQEKKIYEIGSKFGGIPAGQTNGERGYMLTFVIAYIRDLGLEFNVLAESFETSVPWDRAVSLCRNVKYVVGEECKKLNIEHYLMAARVTQTYDAGCVIYFYFGYNYSNIKNPVEVYEQIEEKARDEIIESGGSISHHHGVGKIRRKWYPGTISAIGVQLFKATKQELDPRNVFACGNILKSKL